MLDTNSNGSWRLARERVNPVEVMEAAGRVSVSI
jgi:hypothetical protein